VTVVFGSTSKRIDLVDTERNGVYTLPFQTELMTNVAGLLITVKQGAISALEYPYCAKTPMAKISFKKLAGPPNLRMPTQKKMKFWKRSRKNSNNPFTYALNFQSTLMIQ